MIMLLIIGISVAVSIVGATELYEFPTECTHPFCDSLPDVIVDEELNKLDQEDPKLINYIKENLIGPRPSVKGFRPARLRLNFETEPRLYPKLSAQYGQPMVVEKLLGHIENGFFIEAGAHNGYSGSNSLLFEEKYNWTGLLVEPNRKSFKAMLTLNRDAYLFPHCFSTTNTPETISFDLEGEFGGIINSNDENMALPGDTNRVVGLKQKHAPSTQQMQCFPFYSVMLALGNPTVHYMTLDIEGAELPILKTIPFDKVDIKILDIEVEHVGKVFEGDHRELRTLLRNNGYILHQRVKGDEIYVKKDLLS